MIELGMRVVCKKKVVAGGLESTSIALMVCGLNLGAMCYVYPREFIVEQR
jgi:hypothetical protein